MRGCSGMDEYEARMEKKNHSILTTKKLDYTTGLNKDTQARRTTGKTKTMKTTKDSIR